MTLPEMLPILCLELHTIWDYTHKYCINIYVWHWHAKEHSFLLQAKPLSFAKFSSFPIVFFVLAILTQIFHVQDNVIS